MKTHIALDQLEVCAVEALKALLGDVSVIKLKELKRASTGPGQAVAAVAHIEVLGRSHSLALAVKANAEPGLLRTALRGLGSNTSQLGGDVTPVIFAPYLSPEAQSVCKESHTAFFDLEGNARLAVGEFFIGKRALPHQNAGPASVAAVQVSAPPSSRGALKRMPAPRREVALSA